MRRADGGGDTDQLWNNYQVPNTAQLPGSYAWL